ncbi:MAG TPA: NAD-dependent epimerase/dehydratase family protein [Actinomycetota bacterium]|nr:NAD-dependent epimerase/dehydratase family protein [Actinomycetota bacterium]
MAGPVLVTGGSGFVGGALVERLVGHGRDVRALARAPDSTARVTSLGATPVPGDVLDLEALVEAMRGCEVVFHAAGVNAMCVRDPRPMYRVNIEGSGNVVRAAVATEVRRMVYTSSASAIGEVRGTVGREDSPHRGSYLSHYERSKHLAERRVMSWARRLGLDVVSVNPSSVQGPGRLGGSARLLLDLVNGKLPVVVQTDLSIVDIQDCTAGHLLAEADGVAGERYLLNGFTIDVGEALAVLRRLTGRPGRVRFAPRWLVPVAGEVAQAASGLARRDLPLCREAVRTLRHGHRYDGSRVERELGLAYTPMEQTVRRTLAWYADRGLAPAPLGPPA